MERARKERREKEREGPSDLNREHGEVGEERERTLSLEFACSSHRPHVMRTEDIRGPSREIQPQEGASRREGFFAIEERNKEADVGLKVCSRLKQTEEEVQDTRRAKEETEARQCSESCVTVAFVPQKVERGRQQGGRKRSRGRGHNSEDQHSAIADGDEAPMPPTSVPHFFLWVDERRSALLSTRLLKALANGTWRRGHSEKGALGKRGVVAECVCECGSRTKTLCFSNHMKVC